MVRTSEARPETPRARKRRQTLDRIVAEATTMVTEGGYEALTIAALAKRLGYAVGALYRYFDSKDAILVAVQTRIVEAIEADLADAAERVEAELEARSREPAGAALLRLVTALRVYESLVRRRRRQFGVLSLSLGDPRALLTDDEVRGHVLPTLVGVLGEVTELFALAVEREALSPGDARTRTIVIWGALHGVLSLDKLERLEVVAASTEELAGQLVRATLAGWGADPALLDDAWRAARALTDRLDDE